MMKNWKELLSSAKEKLKNGGAKKLLASRAFLVTGCAVLIAAAVTVSALFGRFTGKSATEDSEAGKVLGNSVLVNDVTETAETSGTEKPAEEQEEPDDFMALSVLNRDEVRKEAMAVLQQIADNPDVMPDEKEDALTGIASIVREMEAEANIETLAAAKGISRCVAVISGSRCSLIVDAETLEQAELTQLQEIVYEQSGILPSGMKIILNASES